MSMSDSFRLLGGIFLTISLLTGGWFFFVLGGFFFFLLAVQAWWSKRIHTFLHIACTSGQTRVMPHSPVTVRIQVENRAYLPLPATMLTFTLPITVQVEGADAIRDYHKQQHIQLFLHLPSRSKTIREITLVPGGRGVIWISEMLVEMISPFATEPCVEQHKTSYNLLVYPELIVIPPVQRTALEPLGRRLSMQRVQDDPAFIRGIRNYLPGDRQKSIDWKATAKTTVMQTRLLEFTSSQKWVLAGHILPAYEAKQQRSNDRENEKVISALASVAARFRKERTPYTLYLNVKQRGKDGLYVPEGSGKEHFVHLLTQLAKMNHFVQTPLAKTMRRLEASTQKLSILLVSARFDEEIRLMAERLILRGHVVALLDLSGEAPQYRTALRSSTMDTAGEEGAYAHGR